LGEVEFSDWVDDKKRGYVCEDCYEAGLGSLSKTILEAIGRHQDAVEFYHWLLDQEIEFPTEEEVEAALTEHRRLLNDRCGKCGIPNIEHLPEKEKDKGAMLSWIEERQMWLCDECQ
jgi:hypothetical protein